MFKQLDQAPLGLSSRDFYLEARNSTMLLAYEEYAVSIALELGASESQTRREMKDMVDFEIQLANVSSHQKSTYKISHPKMVDLMCTIVDGSISV